MTKLSEAARAMGRKGGKSKSPAKLAAIRKNAQKAGRPLKDLDKLSRSGLWRRKQREARGSSTNANAAHSIKEPE